MAPVRLTALLRRRCTRYSRRSVSYSTCVFRRVIPEKKRAYYTVLGVIRGIEMGVDGATCDVANVLNGRLAHWPAGRASGRFYNFPPPCANVRARVCVGQTTVRRAHLARLAPPIVRRPTFPATNDNHVARVEHPFA